MGELADLFEDPADNRAALRLRTTEATPDQAGEALQLARRYHLPPAVAKQFAEDYRRRAVADDAQAALQRSPRLRSWIAEDQTRAEVAQDDIGNLAEVEKTLAAMRSGGAVVDQPWQRAKGPAPSFSSVMSGVLQSLPQGFRLMSEGLSMQAGDVLGLETPQALRRYQQEQARVQASVPDFESSTARGVYSGLTSIARQVPGLAASVLTRSSAPALATMGLQVEGEAYGKYRARGATPGQALTGAVGEAAVEVATEKLPMSFIVDKFGKTGARQFLAGLLLREVPSEQAATLAQDAIDTAIANPEKTWADYAAERPEAAYQTLVATLTQAGVMGAASKVMGKLSGEEGRAAQAEAMAQRVADLQQFAAASKVQARDAQTFREFVAQVADEEGEAPTEFFVDGPQLAKVLNQSAMTMEELAALAPTVAAQASGNIATWGQVRVPVSEFLALGDKAAGLVDHVRTDADAPTRAEAAEFMKTKGDALAAEVERELARVDDVAGYRASVAEVSAVMQAELDAAGRFRPEVNKAYADLIGNFYGATAARLGMTPTELLGRYRLKVARQQGSGARTMGQAAALEWEARDSAPVGAWVKADFKTDNEQPVYQVQEIDPSTLYLPELDAAGRLQPEKRRDLQRYVDRAKAGEKPPAIIVIEMEDGRLRVVDGHRRALAAIEAGTQIRALVSPMVVADGGRHAATTADLASLNQSAQSQTDTEAFRAWFGESKVVDSQGKPLVVYHGTTADFTSFDLQRGGAVTGAADAREGFFFASNPKAADQFTWKAGDKVGSIMPVYLSMTNPAYSDLVLTGGNGRAAAMQIRDAKAAGHDGVVFRDSDMLDHRGQVYVAFRPEQIKSATGNRGTFDPADPSILNQSGLGFDAWVGDATRVDIGDAHEFNDGEAVVVAALHGTTGDFTTFDAAMANIESDLGGGFYFTNNPADVGENYAGMGPDLTNKIQVEAERLESNEDLDPEEAKRIARDKWMANEGLTMPVWVKMNNPAVLGGSRETFLDYTEEYNEDTDEYGEPTGSLLKVIEALRDIASDERYGDADIEQVIGELAEKAMDNGGLTAREVIATAKLSEGLVYAVDYESDGKLAPQEILRLAFEAAGFDGFIDQTVDEKFGSSSDAQAKYGKGMKGMDADTVHFIAFAPTQIKSRLGNNGEFDPSNPNILKQGGDTPRAQISLPQDFASESAVIRLLENADLSSFIHESGHLFLEIHADLAVKIQASIDSGESVSEQERGIVADFNRLLEWFGVKGVEQASGATGGALDQPAYHGTPYRGIDKFSTDKIGTGEGAQAYGWGLYFASKKEIAEHYRKELAAKSSQPVRRFFKGEELQPGTPRYHAAALLEGNNTLPGVRKDLQRWINEARPEMTREVAGWRETLAVLNEATTKRDFTKKAPQGQLYEVEVPDDEHLLLWDKPLSEQPAAVREALDTFIGNASYEVLKYFKNADADDYTGKDLYTNLKQSFFNLAQPNDAKAASEALQALGIKGIKYLDGTSRGAGEGTFNYVIFSGDDVAVRATFYQGGPQEEGRQPSMQGRTPLETWAMMSLEEKRQFHEQFARGFEAFAFEGKAPSLELAGIFARFRSWLLQVYKTVRNLKVTLTDDVREVMGRMIATDLAIEEAEAARAMGPLFTDPDGAAKWGMTLEEFQQYQALASGATEAALSELQGRSLRDMKWLSRATDKALKARQAEVEALRREVRIEARAQVMAEPVYKAWQFLTGRAEKDETATADKAKKGQGLDRERDSLLTAIAKLGGITRESAARDLSISADYFRTPSGVFGKPIFRKEGGLSVDYMAEALAEQGYLPYDEDGKHSIRDLEDRIQSELAGEPQYSYWHDYGNGLAAIVGDVVAGKLRTSEVPADKREVLKAHRMLREDGGLHPDQVAELFGFAAGDQLVEALALADPPKDAIEELTDRIMMERHGDITSPEALQRAADEAVHNEMRARVMAAELRALAKANKVTGKDERTAVFGGGTVNLLAKAAKDLAANVVARQRVRDIRPGQYSGAEARNGRLAAKALAAGKLDEAAMHKRNQLINTYATKAAYDAQDEVKKALAFFAKVNKGTPEKIAATRDVAMVNAARAVLAEYGLGTKGEAAADYLKALESYDPDSYKVLRDRIDAMVSAAKPYRDMSVEEFRGLVEGVRDLWDMAKRSRQVEIDGKLFDRTKVQLELVDRLNEIGVPDRVPGEGSAVTAGERFTAQLRSFGAALRRVESWVDSMDGGGMGAFRRYVWQPVKEAADTYRAEKAKRLKQYRELLKTVEFKPGLISDAGLGYVFGKGSGSGKAEVMHAILHTGNESNKRKLLLGRGWAEELPDGSMDTGRWDAFLARMVREGVLTKADFDFAQGVWDMLDEMKPAAQQAHKAVFGHFFAEVTADGFTMTWPDGQTSTYRGGYVPATADPEAVQEAAVRQMMEDENSSLAFAFPSTNRGFTKSRVEYNTKLLLDLRSIAQHIDKVLLFTHMEQPVRDVRRILTSRDVSEPLGRVAPAAFAGLLTPWLNRAARQVVETPVAGSNGLMRFFSVLRSRAGMAAMFANLANTAQQVTGLSIAALKVPPKHLLAAAAQMVHSPRKTAKAVAEASQYMASRMDNEVAAMSQEINDILLNPNVYEKAKAWTARHAYFMQSAVDNVIGPIVWTGAYNQALEAGQDEKDARRLADAAVRQTQGSTLAEDVSRMETGNSFVRLFTQFYGYFNMQANLLGTEWVNTMRQAGLRSGMGRGVYIFTLGFLAPALVSELIVQAFRGGPGDEDEDGEWLDDWLAALGLGTMRSGVAMVPAVGPVLNMAANGFNSKPYDDRISTSPGISMVESAGRAPASVYKAVTGEGSAQKAVRDVATLISITTGLPAGAAARPIGYLAGVADGRTEPTSGADAVRGAITGVASPESRQ